MDKNKIWTIAGLTLILIAGVVFWGTYDPDGGSTSSSPIDENASFIFFYGQECSHCQDVEKFLEDNQIGQKVQFDSLEVWHNRQNADFMAKKVAACGLSQDQAGVPFLYVRGKCFVGTLDVEAAFRQEAGI